MAIGDAIATIGCLAGFMLALPALLIFLNLAFIGLSDRATERLWRGGITPFFVGLIPVLFIGGPAVIGLASGSFLQFCGGIVFLFVLFWGFLGLAVVARLAGQRLTAMYERDESPLVQTVAGSLVLSFSVAFPLLGWLIILPFSLIIGSGALLMVLAGGWWDRLFNRSAPATPAASPGAAWPPSEYSG
ncbi:MAG: hypothetical protein GYB66_11735 [Chloroflexi bacterium]|nr:hypothetical protein [Chloroflexota bacterium]